MTYKGFRIIKTYKHGYNYYKVEGFSKTYSYQRDAKLAIDRMLEEQDKAERCIPFYGERSDADREFAEQVYNVGDYELPF